MIERRRIPGIGAPIPIILCCVGLVSIAPHARAQPGDSLTFTGTYFHERFTEAHEYLYQLDLWVQETRVLGLSSSFEGLSGGGLPWIRRVEGTLRADTLHLSDGFVGWMHDSVLTGVDRDGDAHEMEFRRSPDRMETNPASAPRTSSVHWREWADRVIDDNEAKDPYLQQQRARCASGDAWACLGIGNGYTDRKPDEARRYWKMACDGGAWAGCKFLGDSTQMLSILTNECSGDREPSLHRNMACEELGKRAEHAGRKTEAIRWYRLGCNDYKLPTTCCNRLQALGVHLPASGAK